MPARAGAPTPVTEGLTPLPPSPRRVLKSADIHPLRRAEKARIRPQRRCQHSFKSSGKFVTLSLPVTTFPAPGGRGWDPVSVVRLPTPHSSHPPPPNLHVPGLSGSEFMACVTYGQAAKVCACYLRTRSRSFACLHARIPPRGDALARAFQSACPSFSGFSGKGKSAALHL